MQSVTSFNFMVTGWLSRLASWQPRALARAALAQRALAQGAQRFASLVAPPDDLEVAREVARGHLATTLRITSGRHKGAFMELTGDKYVIGSGDDCQIVLRGVGVAARHCRLTREWSGMTVSDLRPPVAQSVTPRRVRYAGGAIVAKYDIGGVRFTLRHLPPPAARQRSFKHPAWLSAGVVAAVSVVAVTLTATTGAMKQTAGTAAPQIEALDRALAGQGLGSIHISRGAHGELQANGTVPDVAHRGRLEEWLATNQIDAAHVSVVSTSDLLEQARRALADDALSVELRDGRLLVAGRTSQPALKGRIHTLAEDLQGTIALEDHVVYTPEDPNDPPGPLPVRVQGVMISTPSYFVTDSGVRYFVGGVLPDGAEVLSIDGSAIQFRRAGQLVVYKLQ